MKTIYNLIFCASILLFQPFSVTFAQDNRTVETKTADLLAQMPAQNLDLRNKLIEEFISLGEEGFKIAASQITPSGLSNNSAAVFLLNGLTRYSGKAGMEEKRAYAEKNFIQAMGNASSPEIKSFFMRQLKLIGKEDAVKAVAPYLTNNELSEPSASVLFSIGSQSAKSALVDALSKADEKTMLPVIKVLGELRAEEANESITRKLSSGNAEVKRVCLAALAEIASPNSYNILLNEARRINFKYDPTNASAAFLTYAGRLGEKGNLSLCKKACEEIIRSCKSTELLHSSAAAYAIYARFFEKDSQAKILKAYENPDKEYRLALLNLVEKNKTSGVTEKWIKKAQKSDQETKAEIITMLGKKGDSEAIGFVKSQMYNSSPVINEPAIAAYTRLIGREAIPELTAVLKEGINNAAVTKALLSIADEKHLDGIVLLLDDSPSPVKIEAIKITGAKAGKRFFDKIYKYSNDPDENIRKASFLALENVSSSKDVDQLIVLLSSVNDKSAVSNIQNAIVNALSSIQDENTKVSSLLNHLNTVKNKERIIEILPRIGGSEALKAVNSFTNSSDNNERNAALTALINWKDPSASAFLFEISKSSTGELRSSAVKGFIHQIRNSAIPDDQKLLHYRKIIPYASNKAEKILAIESIGRLKTFLSLITVSEYLNDAETSAPAAQAVMNIALPSQNYAGISGALARDILSRAADKLSGQDSEYEKAKIRTYLAEMPKGEGYISMFNGKDLSGWQGLVEDPIKRSKMKPQELAKKQAEADLKVPKFWGVKDGCIVFNGDGDNLCSVKEYGDFEMIVDWRITKKGDSGIYLRGTPQIQIWDTSRVEVGAQVGSGGLYNNKKNPSKPLKVADNPVGDWNTFRIKMIGDKVTVYLNGELVVNNVVLENFWDRSMPLFPKGSIELQAHGTDLAFRDIYVKEINNVEYSVSDEEKREGFKPLFNGKNLDGWIGNTVNYQAEEGEIVLRTEGPSSGNLYTKDEYSDFILRFEFQLTPGANNGLGIRAPLKGDAAYVGMELQILDNEDPIYAKLKPYQYHGSVYGIIPAKRGYLKPTGEWNSQEVIAKGNHIKVILNGTTILDGNIKEATADGTPDKREHPGLFNEKGHIGFLGHGSPLKFRNLRIKDLSR